MIALVSEISWMFDFICVIICFSVFVDIHSNGVIVLPVLVFQTLRTEVS